MKWTLLLVCRTLCHTDQSAVKQWSVRHHNDVYWQYETWLLFYDFSRFHSPNSFWINVLCMRICFRIVFVFFFFRKVEIAIYVFFFFIHMNMVTNCETIRCQLPWNMLFYTDLQRSNFPKLSTISLRWMNCGYTSFKS